MKVTGAMLRRSDYRLAKNLWALMDVLEEGHTATELAAAIDISRATTYRYLEWCEDLGVQFSRARFPTGVVLRLQTPPHRAAELLARCLLRDIAPRVARHLALEGVNE